MHAAIAIPLRSLDSMTATGMPATSPDIALVDAARAGDSDAFGRLYAEHARMVHGIMLARVPRDDADDLVQEVFLAAFRKLHTLRDAAAFGPWLCMIARNRARDYYRHSRETVELPDEIGSADPPEAESILAVVQTLPEAYRETLVLRLVEGMTGPEIAERE